MKRLREIYISASEPYERGVQHGSQIKEKLSSVLPNYQMLFSQEGYTWENIQEMALAYVPYLDSCMPDLMQEARGIADGAGVPLSHVMVMNTRYELLKFKKGTDHYKDAECTCFLVTAEATKDKETFAGQNWDNSPFIGENLYILHEDDGHGTVILGLTEPAQLVRSGMNSHGISINCSTLKTTLDYQGISIPTNFMRRQILQCRTLTEAKQLIETFKPCVSLNYVIGSKDAGGAVYETTPGEHYPVYLVNGIAAQGNDLKMNPAIERFLPADPTHTIHFRGQRLDYLLHKKEREITLKYIQESLKDHYGYPSSICNHTPECGLQTIASTIYCLNRDKAYVSWGNPCEVPYEEYLL